MRPVVLLTGGLRGTKKNIPEVRCYINYADAVERAGALPVLSAAVGGDSLERLAKLADGLFLTGGEDVDPARYHERDRGECGAVCQWRDTIELRLCESFVRQKKPIFGICRGIQILNVFFGGNLVQDLEADKGIIHPYGAGHALATLSGSWLRGAFGETFTVNSYHHQALERLGEGLTATAWSAGGKIVEAVEHEELPVFAVQWHPERMTGEKRYDPEGPDMSACFTRFCGMCKGE